ncbi:recombinase family protein [Chthonobacter rhizosphaerae]|uniref:recombinase family protein n=1 Tax=Chthonobacter rhizosphaerae TaxID=2735553 RepID=UPI0015EF110B|nr:recombinase family protein [Chthonobacter rhizosphaerae]
MTAAPRKALRCAIYTRKSTEHGLEQEFNSLEAQREACEAYIKSQAHEGWRCLPERYDNGGFSGGSMQRPALQELLDAIRAGRVDVVVYKVDRLTRSLADFAKLVETFDAAGVSFVSVTQAFNTTSSMGRLTLNVLLSFAQFEREVTGERIRDKVAASKKKGMRMGGPVLLGYEVRDKCLIPYPQEVETVRLIFSRYLELGCLTALARDLRERGIVTKVSGRRDGTTRGGIPFTKGPLAYLLRNRVYVGEVIYKGQHYKGEHKGIVPAELFLAVQEALSSKARSSGGRQYPASPLVGRIYDDRGNRMTPTGAKKGGVRYRYYTSSALVQGEPERAGSVPRVPAPEIEGTVQEALARALAVTASTREGTAESELYLACVERVVVRQGELEVSWRLEGEASPSGLVVPWSAPTRRPRRALLGAEQASLPARPIRSETRARLVEGIAKARAWVDELVTGKVTDTHAIARREGCSERSIRMALNLAFLSPEIVRGAIEGTLPHGVGLCSLSELPASWAKQNGSYKFSGG